MAKIMAFISSAHICQPNPCHCARHSPAKKTCVLLEEVSGFGLHVWSLKSFLKARAAERLDLSISCLLSLQPLAAFGASPLGLNCTRGSGSLYISWELAVAGGILCSRTAAQRCSFIPLCIDSFPSLHLYWTVLRAELVRKMDT